MQEYTRLATSLCREFIIADESGELRTAAAAIVAALFDKVDEILAVEHGKFPVELARRWHKPLAIFRRGPPALDQGYYYYGLLDCVSQLAAMSDPQTLGEGLLNRIIDLVFDSVVPEFRWKAASILEFRSKASPVRSCYLSTNHSHRSKSFWRVVILVRKSTNC